MKKGMAAALVFAMAFSAFALSNGNTYAANAVDLTKECSLTVEVEAGSLYEGDLDQMTIPVALYRVADVDVSGNYTALAGFEEVGLEKISNTTTADDWLSMAQKAAGKLTESSKAAADIEVVNGTGTADELKAGMYLVVPEETYNKDYSYLYQFTPYLTALPGNDYYTYNDEGEAVAGENDDWIYDTTIGLKVEREMQYGKLTINKQLLGYNALAGEGYFVFQIEGEKDGVKYSNVASITMTASGDASVTVSGIPVGMQVTVTEVYSGGSYEAAGNTAAETTVIADQAGGGAGVSFENEYNDKLIPGTGVLNQFTAPEDNGDWGWAPDDSSVIVEEE